MGDVSGRIGPSRSDAFELDVAALFLEADVDLGDATCRPVPASCARR